MRSREAVTQASVRVRYAAAGSVAHVTLARPEKRNALDGAAIQQLREALAAAERDDSVRSVVLDSDGPDFCAGADLAALAALLDADRETHRADAQRLADLYLAMRALPKPIIAAVQGRALAGGAGLATACDMVIAADDAQFGYPEVKIGFVAAMVTALLRTAVGEKAAFELLATGRAVRADEAARIGLITRVVPRAELARAVEDAAGAFTELPAEGLARTKKLFYAVEGLPLAQALERGVQANVESRSTASFRDGLRSFLSRKQR